MLSSNTTVLRCYFFLHSLVDLSLIQSFPPLFSVPHDHVKSLFMLGCLYCFHPVYNFRSFSTNKFLCQPHAQPPTWGSRVSIFVWVITFDLSGMGGPTRSYPTASIALRIIDHPSPATTSQYGYLQGVICYLLMKIKVFFFNERHVLIL